jgi:hypothetical protein
MNITSKIAEEIGGELEKIYSGNAEIQFYANSATDEYQWKDSRFEETAGVLIINLEIQEKKLLLF